MQLEEEKILHCEKSLPVAKPLPAANSLPVAKPLPVEKPLLTAKAPRSGEPKPLKPAASTLPKRVLPLATAPKRKVNPVRAETAEKRRRTDGAMHTPPRQPKRELSLQGYEELEKNGVFMPYKEKGGAQSFSSAPSSADHSFIAWKDLELPKLETREKERSSGKKKGDGREKGDELEKHRTNEREKKGSNGLERQQQSSTQKNEAETRESLNRTKEAFARQQEDEIDLLLSESNGCHCKGKCSNRKCPCRNFGKECGAQCRCQHDKCSNRVCPFNECVTGRQHRFP